MIFGNAGFAQADRHDGRVPHRRETRLDAHVVFGFVFELLQFVRGADDLRMVVADSRAPSSAMSELSIAGKIAARPSLPSKRSSIHCSHFFSAVLRNGWMLCSANHSASLCRRSSHRKKLRQRNLFRIGRQRQVAFVDAFGIQLVQIHLHRARRLEMVDDGQRHDHARATSCSCPRNSRGTICR